MTCSCLKKLAYKTIDKKGTAPMSTELVTEVLEEGRTLSNWVFKEGLEF